MVKKATSRGFELALGDVSNGSLTLLVHETVKSQNKISLNLQALKLPARGSMWEMNFSTTYYLEIYRGQRGNNAKIYESEWFTNDPNHQFDLIELTDDKLCGTDHTAPIEFKFINRNQFKMINTEVCY